MLTTLLAVTKSAVLVSATIHGGSYTVAPHDTLSTIAVSHGDNLAAVEAANPQITDPNVIYVGETVALPATGTAGPSDLPATATGSVPVTVAGDHDGDLDGSAPPAAQSASQPPSQPASAPTGTGSSSALPTSSGGGGYSIPGMPSSLANCIAFRESTNGTNPAANGNVFGIIPASGYNVAGDSVAQQEQIAGQIYATAGGAAWAADSCPGT